MNNQRAMTTCRRLPNKYWLLWLPRINLPPSPTPTCRPSYDITHVTHTSCFVTSLSLCPGCGIGVEVYKAGFRSRARNPKKLKA